MSSDHANGCFQSVDAHAEDVVAEMPGAPCPSQGFPRLQLPCVWKTVAAPKSADGGTASELSLPLRKL